MRKTFIYLLGLIIIVTFTIIAINSLAHKTTYSLCEANVKALSTTESQTDQGKCGQIFVWKCYYECLCGALYEARQLYPGPMTEIRGYCDDCGRELKK